MPRLISKFLIVPAQISGFCAPGARKCAVDPPRPDKHLTIVARRIPAENMPHLMINIVYKYGFYLLERLNARVRPPPAQTERQNVQGNNSFL
jgi:hypothetical protein